MKINNNLINQNSVKLKQNGFNSKNLSFKADTKTDNVNLNSYNPEELTKPNKTVIRICYAIAGAVLGCMIEKNIGFLAVIMGMIGESMAENKIKLSEINDKLEKAKIKSN